MDGHEETWVGPYIGETLGRARSIVHFDPLLAATRNRPTAVAITGEPGGGKTTLALLLILQLALRGVTVAVIDPKGDAESLVDVLQARGRKARVLPLGGAAPGLLDPFSFGDDLAEKRTMATETLRLLLPRMSEERESAMIQAVGAVAGRDRPSLGKVVRYLEQAEGAAARNLGAVLRSMSEMRLARLCFAPSGGQRIDAAGWTTVFTLAGLTLPDAAVSRDDFSYEQRLSVALLYLVSQFARRLLNGMDRRLPKAIFLDEAWAITSTPEGAKLVPEVSRMGRSRNTALILVSQNAGDLLSEQVTNCISGVFAFRSSERVEVANVMALLGVEASDEHQMALRGLGNGECIFRDLEGRVGRIGIDLVSDEMRQWLDTNPTHRKPGEAAPRVSTEPPPGAEPTAGGEPKAGAGPVAGQPSAPGTGQPSASAGPPPAPGIGKLSAPGAAQLPAPGTGPPSVLEAAQPPASAAGPPSAPGTGIGQPSKSGTGELSAQGAAQLPAQGAGPPSAPEAAQPSAPGGAQPSAPEDAQLSAPGGAQPSTPGQPSAPGTGAASDRPADRPYAGEPAP
jgi:hypothetical protein